MAGECLCEGGEEQEKERGERGARAFLTPLSPSNPPPQTDRKLIPKDWRARLAVIQMQAVAAAADLPSDLAPVDAQSIDYDFCVSTRDTLAARGGRTLLGGYAGPAAHWHKLVRAYDRCKGSVGEAALVLAHNVDFEVPSLRAATARARTALTDIDRKKGELARSGAAAAKEFVAACGALGVEGVDVDSELAALAASAPSHFRAGAASLRSEAVGAAADYYAAFTAYAHGKSGTPPASAAELLPALAAVRAADFDNDADAAPAAAADSAADAVTEIAWDVDDAGDSGGGGGGDSGGISWDIGTVEPEGPPSADATASTDAPIDIEWDIGVVGGHGDAATPAAPSAAVTLADDPDARAALGDDVAELAAFLTALEGGGAISLPPDAPDSVATPPAADVLASARADLSSAADALSGDRARTLLLLRAGGAAAARLAAGLKAKGGAGAKVARLSAQLDERAATLTAQLAADAPKLAAALAATRAAKEAAEARISALVNGRKINIVGEVNACLASG